jgi:hypothetical protein
MKHFKPLSLSLQKEIAQRNICLESEIDRSMDSFGFRTMLHQLSRDTIFYDFLWSQFIPFVFVPTVPTYSLGNPPPEANPK